MGPNALEYITIKGFRSIASIEKFPVRPINIVIGANGSGKSNFLGVFELARQIGDRLDAYVARAGGANRLLHFGSKRTQAIVCEWTFRGDSGELSFSLKPSVEDKLWGSSGRNTLTDDVHEGFAKCRVYHFHDTSASSPLRLQSRIDDNRLLRPDGSNLAAFLHLLRKKHLSAYNDVVSAVRQVAPFFLDFQVEPLALKPDEVKLEWKHRSDDQYFDAAALSDGTLRFMAIATLLLQPPELLPSVILLDEPELGLHPYAIGLLASLIRQASRSSN